MRVRTKLGMAMVASVLAVAGAAQAQEMKMPAQEQGHPMQMTVVKPEYPRMGRAQENAKGGLFTLEQAQKIAGASNPTLRQAEAEIRAAKARQQQAGLYPNPTVAYTGDEIRGGSVGGGKQGFFVQQTVVTGGKLGLSREVFGKEVSQAIASPWRTSERRPAFVTMRRPALISSYRKLRPTPDIWVSSAIE